MGVYNFCINSLKNLNSTYFERRLDACKIRKIKKDVRYAVSFDYTDVKYLIFSIQDLLVFVCMPCACIIGLILNIRVVGVIKKNQTNVFKEDFYIYMRLNSKFNCANCLIFSFYSINYCNQFNSDYFCSYFFSSLCL
jgi:hypothetical protein